MDKIYCVNCRHMSGDYMRTCYANVERVSFDESFERVCLYDYVDYKKRNANNDCKLYKEKLHVKFFRFFKRFN